ncbi:sulfite exporter TauE/SafE family protein [Shimia sp.]|uniref:sulfite exporter TauE/SafE family protein n=1 Tax=Shimia sp. TaxID=1954381 RepID=UPI003297EE55
MPEIWSGVWSIEGLPWIIGIAFIAGLVRGFAGFGTAMIYLPVAGQFLPPIWAILTLAVMDLIGPLPNLPQVWKDAHRRDLVRLIVGMLVLMPVGIAVLLVSDPGVFRYGVSILGLGLLALLISGFRYRGTLRAPMIFGIGGVSGFLGGVVGMPGPPVILFYMASPHGPAIIRANTMLFLLSYDVLVLVMFSIQGLISAVPVALGLALIIPNLIGNWLGGIIFRPEYEKTYRAVAYVIIAASAISGLPFLS